MDHKKFRAAALDIAKALPLNNFFITIVVGEDGVFTFAGNMPVDMLKAIAAEVIPGIYLERDVIERVHHPNAPKFKTMGDA